MILRQILCNLFRCSGFVNDHRLVVYVAVLHIKNSQFKPSTAQKVKFSIKDIFSKCDQIRRNLALKSSHKSHLLKKTLMKKLIFCSAHEATGISDP